MIPREILKKSGRSRFARTVSRPKRSRHFILTAATHDCRVAVSYETEAEEKTSETVVRKILDELPVP